MKRLFMIVWGSFVIVWAFAVSIKGEYHYGKGANAPLITEADDPWAFWVVVVGTATIGAAVIIFAIKKVPRDGLISPEDLEK